LIRRPALFLLISIGIVSKVVLKMSCRVMEGTMIRPWWCHEVTPLLGRSMGTDVRRGRGSLSTHFHREIERFGSESNNDG
jgi:hypothetical protein